MDFKWAAAEIGRFTQVTVEQFLLFFASGLN